MPFVERIIAKLERHGEQFSIGSKTWRGIFKILDAGSMRAYLDDVEIMGVEKPGLMLIAPSATQIEVDDKISRDGREYEVKKVSIHRIGDKIAAKVAILV